MGHRESFAAATDRHPARIRRLLPVAATITLLLGLSAIPSQAAATPLLDLDLHHRPTNFAPNSTGDYSIEVTNSGDTATSGLLTLLVALPSPLSRSSIRQVGSPVWSCPGSPGDHTILCTTADPIARHSVARNLILTATTTPTASGERFAAAKLEGGGAPAPTTTSELTRFDPKPAPFGAVPGGFLADSFAPDATTVRAAGAHPDRVVVALDLSTIASPLQIAAAADIRHFQLALPPGFLGNPTAPATCAPAQLTIGACPGSSQVGRVKLTTGPFGLAAFPKIHSKPVFNMEHPRGVLADLAFAISGNPVHIKFSLDPTNGYAILASAADINETESLLDLRMTLWGVPADPSHDSERCGLPDTASECSADIEAKPFLTVPSQCGVDQAIVLRGVDSWQRPGASFPRFATSFPARAPNATNPASNPPSALPRPSPRPTRRPASGSTSAFPRTKPPMPSPRRRCATSGSPCPKVSASHPPSPMASPPVPRQRLVSAPAIRSSAPTPPASAKPP